MPRVLVDVRAVVDVPNGTKLTPYAMALQDSSAVLFETLQQAGYEVIVHSAPADPHADRLEDEDGYFPG